MQEEREDRYAEIVQQEFKSTAEIKILEIGAGSGNNLLFFQQLNIAPENIYANELLDDRVETLRKNLPGINIFPGNALQLNFKNEFNIVLQSTVFTSILDNAFREKLAAKMFDMIKPGGIGLWYDFIYDNPKNKNVKGVSKTEIKKLFPFANKIQFYSVTLAPPIGRKAGKFYNLINFLFPFLRTHVIAVIYKR